MRVVITDIAVAKCDLTGKENVECLRLQLDDRSPEILCVPAELIKLVRLRKKQDTNQSPIEKKLP